MRAVPFFEHGTSDVLKYHDTYPDPIVRANSDALVRVQFCGLNHLDIWTRQGLPGKEIRLPHICGSDIAGTLVSESKKLQKGDRVIIYPGTSCNRCPFCLKGKQNLCKHFSIIGGMSNHDGGYAEFVVVPKINLLKIPDMLKPDIASLLSVSYLTAWSMLKKIGYGPDQTALVYGASGGLGMATIQLIKAMGGRVITTASDSSKAAFAKMIGADLVIDRNKQSVEDEVKSATDGVGADVVFDHVGAATWKTSILSLKIGGKMAVCGMTSGNDATIPVRTFYTKQIAMFGFLMGSMNDLIELIDFVIENNIKPIVHKKFSLQDASKAQLTMERGLQMGKILLDISN